MIKDKVTGFFKCIPSTFKLDYERGFLVMGPLIYSKTNAKYYTEGSGNRPPREEQIDSVKMPGFVNPQTIHDEGHFTQKAKQQLEELKKKLDKPTIDNREKKD